MTKSARSSVPSLPRSISSCNPTLIAPTVSVPRIASTTSRRLGSLQQRRQQSSKQKQPHWIPRHSGCRHHHSRSPRLRHPRRHSMIPRLDLDELILSARKRKLRSMRTTLDAWAVEIPRQPSRLGSVKIAGVGRCVISAFTGTRPVPCAHKEVWGRGHSGAGERFHLNGSSES